MKAHLLLCFIALLETSLSVASVGVQISSPHCLTAGTFLCDTTCRALGTCINDGSNRLKWEQLEDCGAMFCDAVRNTCSETISSCETAVTKFECGTNGTSYPNPYDCKTFYTCNSTGSIERGSCPSNKGYDSCTKECGISLNNYVCPTTNTAVCKKLGEYVVIQQNTRQYYLCKINVNGTLVALMLQCPENSYFDISSRQCVPSTESGCTPGGGTVDPEKCTSVGDYPDPDNCRMFYRCNVIGDPATHYTCGSNKYFDKTSRKCVYGDCSN